MHPSTVISANQGATLWTGITFDVQVLLRNKYVFALHSKKGGKAEKILVQDEEIYFKGATVIVSSN